MRRYQCHGNVLDLLLKRSWRYGCPVSGVLGSKDGLLLRLFMPIYPMQQFSKLHTKQILPKNHFPYKGVYRT